MNSLSGVIYEDFVSKFIPKDVTQKRVSNILKLIAMVIGIGATLMVFLVEKLGGLLPLSISFSSITSGPLVGMFTLGIFFPTANAKGALAGSITALVFIAWIVIGAYYYKVVGLLKYTLKPTSIEGCLNTTSSFTSVSQFAEIKNNDTSEDSVFFLFRITYYYYCLIGATIVIIVGLTVSWLTNSNEEPVDEKLITPWMRWAIPKPKQKYKSIAVALKEITDNAHH